MTVARRQEVFLHKGLLFSVTMLPPSVLIHNLHHSNTIIYIDLTNTFIQSDFQIVIPLKSSI